MPTLTIRQLDEDVYRGLKNQAEYGGHSMEAEVRAILGATVRGRLWWGEWLRATKPLRGEKLLIPSRSFPREIK